MTVEGRKSNPISYRLRSACLAFIAVWMLFETVSAHSQATGNPPSRPLLFVYGFCDESASWEPLRSDVAVKLNADYPALYPSGNVGNAYDAYFDGSTVHFLQNGMQVNESLIPSSTRIFTMVFFDPYSGTYSPYFVAQVSILNKADELAHVLNEIKKVTHITDTIVIAHSMGGLVSRAYLENLASPSYCYDLTYDIVGNVSGGIPDYTRSSCSPGGTPYKGEIAKLITVDTPHGGAAPAGSSLADFLSDFSLVFPACAVTDSTNRTEQIPNSSFLDTINYKGTDAGAAKPIPSGVTVDSIGSWYSDYNLNWDAYVPFGFGSANNDGLVELQAQSLESSLSANAKNSEQFPDLLNPLQTDFLLNETPGSCSTNKNQIGCGCLGPEIYVTSNTYATPYIHSLPCVGAQQSTFNILYPQISSQVSGVSISLGAAPSLSTLAATVVGSDGANLNGTVNANGSAGTAWFEYGTSSGLGTFTRSTPAQSIASATSPVPFAFGLSGQPPNTKYYYRAAASNAIGTMRDTNIVSFTTLGALPAPALLTPMNGLNGQLTAAQFSWTAVPNATAGYRIMISTSSSALPTDPNSDTCAYGCALGPTGDTPPSTTYTPPAGSLLPSTTYFWEVHGRGTSQAGTWSTIWSFTTAAAVTNDFSLQVSPSSQSLAQGSSVAYNVMTATTSGSSQSVTLSASNLPSGLSASFSPATVTSGNQSSLIVAASSSAPAGAYTLTVIGTGTGATHTYPISATVTQAASGPAMTLNSSIFRFNPQAVGSVSSSQTVLLLNSGGGQLKISSIGLLAGSDYALTLPPPATPILNALGTYSFQVAFEPSTTGTRNGEIIVYDNAPGSPHVVSLTGTGTPAQPTTGTINVNATLNGIPLPSSYGYQYSLVGPATYTGYDAYSFSASPGAYTIAFQGNPPFLTLSSVTPSITQAVSAGSSIAFTLNFAGSSDFYPPYFQTPYQIVTTGTTASYNVTMGNPPPGNVQVPVTLAVSGTPAGSTATFTPQPLYTGTGGVLTVSTNTALTLAGLYTLTLSGSNSNGLSHTGGGASSLVVTAPPSFPVQFVSESSSGIQGNGPSVMWNNSVSADGRRVVFTSAATNLTSSSTNTSSQTYVRDLQTSTTSIVSVSNTGALADCDTYSQGGISANGRFVVFSTCADNLYPGSVRTAGGVYVRDLIQGVTEREDVAPDGTPANGNSYLGAISADGRFIAFLSAATNLVGGASGTQVYLRDRKTGRIVLISVAIDGSAANAGSTSTAISADGRFVGFDSTASNLVSQNTNGLGETFVRDVDAGTTSLVSVSSSGVPANAYIYDSGSPLTLSADGRFIAFVSQATNLVPQSVDGNLFHIYVHDAQTQQNTLVDVDSVGTPLVGSAFLSPAISTDGRFVAFNAFGQALVRDLIANQTQVVSVASDGSPANGVYGGWDIGVGGSGIVFVSGATNLIANDTNGATDVFVAQNPFVGNTFLQSLALSSSSASGGSSISGTVTLSGPAPAGGATVAIWSNNAAAQVPATVLVPAGMSSAPISFSTSSVPSETVMTIIASYNGGSPIALLTLEPSAQIAVDPPSWDFGYQPVGSSTATQTFTVSNSGGAALILDSVQLSAGQSFSIGANTCGSSIAPGSNCSVSVTFKPSVSGSISDALQIGYGSPAAFQTMSLTGNGATPSGSLSPATLTLSSPGGLSATATLTNSGNAPLSSISSGISGANAGDFAITNDGCSGTMLPANNSCLITIAFSPKASGTRTATLSIADSASGSPQTIGVTGIEVQSTPAVVWNPSPTSLTYGANLGLGVLDATANVNGGAVGGAFAYTATLGGGMPQAVTPSTILGAGAYTLTAVFTPADLTDYTTATATASIIVNQAPQTVTFAPASPVTYGVSPITLSATGGGSGNPVSFSVLSGPGTISGSSLTITGVGTVVVAANQAGNTNYAAAAQVTQSIVVNAASQAITFTAPTSPLIYGVSPITLSATGGGSGNAVTFSIVSGPGAISGSTLTVTGAGTIVVAADQMGTTYYMDATEVKVNIVVNPASQTITFAPPTSPVVYGVSPITLTATGGSSGNTVTFGIVSGPGKITGTTLTVTGAGTIAIIANQAGNSNYSAATQVSQSIMANPASLTVTANNATRLYGTTNPTFTGSVSGPVNGDTFTVSGTSTATISSDVGKYAIIPAATGANISDYNVTPVNGALTITQAGSAVILSSSNASANLGAPVTFTAMVSSATTGTPTGTVNFFDGQTAISSGTLNAQGVVTYITSSLSTGSHSITAVYMGSMDLTGSTSPILIETVAAPDYSVAVNPTSLTIMQGETGSAIFTVTPLGGFNQSVQFSCSGLPVHATCSFSPTAVTPNGAAVTSTLTISTDVQTSSLVDRSGGPLLALALYSGHIGLGGGLLLCAVRRKNVKAFRGRVWLLGLFVMTLAGAAISVIGCGTGSLVSPITPIGTSVVTVSVSTSASGGISHNATLTVNITQ